MGELVMPLRVAHLASRNERVIRVDIVTVFQGYGLQVGGMLTPKP
jgi:hypothetical protein